MRVVVAAFGTSGNRLPFLGWSRELVRRGHEVVVLGNESIRSQAEGFGAVFHALSDPAANRGSTPVQATGRSRVLPQLAAQFTDLVPESFAAFRRFHQPGKTIFAAATWMYGARVASEVLQAPLVNVALQPKMLPPRAETLRPVRRWVRRAVLRLAERRIAGPIHALQAEAGVPRARQIVDHWCFSRDLVLGFFPDWFAPQALQNSAIPVQPVGFPLFDGGSGERMSPELEEFLDAGTPPVVLAQSTLGTDASQQFYQTAAEALKLLGRRGVILSANPQAVPQNLPPDVRYFGYVPVSQLLPRAQAIVHHGGLGMIAQALKAGIPQVTIPGFLDQPDNCRHLEQLGVSKTLSKRRVTATSLAVAIDQLQLSLVVKQRCRELASRLLVDETFQSASVLLEDLAAIRGLPGVSARGTTASSTQRSA